MFTKWIGLEAAAKKYGIKEEIIFLWVELKKFNDVRRDGKNILFNDKKLEEYVKWRETNMVRADYVDEIELCCYEQELMIATYAEALKTLNAQLNILKEKVNTLEMLRGVPSYTDSH